MTTPKNYAMSGPYSPGSIEYPFQFPVNSESEVAVYVGVERVYDIFTVELSSSGGAIQFNEAPSEPVTIVRDMEFSQELDFQNNTAFLPEVIEGGMDNIVMMIQQLKVLSDRSIKVPFGSTEDPSELADSLMASAAEVKEVAQGFAQSVESAKSDISTLRDEAVAHIEETLGQLGTELDVSIGELV